MLLNIVCLCSCNCRSPGGTPIRKDNQAVHDDDPGAIIARALRQKFSNRVFQDSPGELKELCT